MQTQLTSTANQPENQTKGGFFSYMTVCEQNLEEKQNPL